jgi:acyl-CoA hydrolase
MARTYELEEAVALLRPTDSVGFGLGPANPACFLTALGQRRDWEDLTLGGALFLGLFDVLAHPGVHVRSGFFGPAERYYRSLGSDIQHIPAGFRQFRPTLRRLHPRVMVVMTTPPDEQGLLNLSLHYGATRDELLAAGRDPDRLLIAVTSPHFPRTAALADSPNTLHLDDVDVLVDADDHPFVLAAEPATATDRAIAAHALSFIPLDATLQTGIGSIPTQVATALVDRPGGSYGAHSEMLTDGLFALARAGKLTNEHKGVYPGRSVTTFALGSAELYQWLDGNADVAFAPVSLVNDPSVIDAHHNFVSVNGAIALDLFGQVVADSVQGRQISGVGGHEDFVAGAELQLEDASLICLPSTIEIDGERHSRITTHLPLGSVVATPRHHLSVVVTEFGAADVRGATVRERAHLLADLAHPDFRVALHRDAATLG